MLKTSNERHSTEHPFSKVTYIEINADQENQRIDNFLFTYLKGVPKSHIYRLLRQGEIRVNKKRAKPLTRLEVGDIVRLPPIQIEIRPKPMPPSFLQQRLQATIQYENSDWLVLNKPSGIAVHGGSGLSFGVIEVMRALKNNDSLELAHRLDKETSGCLLIAKKRPALLAVHELLRKKQIKKKYVAVLVGRWHGPKQRIVDEPLKKFTLQGGERMVTVSDQGKPARTMFQLIENFDECCLVSAYPVTGRTHQIRVHAQSMGLPILGDKKYGSTQLLSGNMKALGAARLFLHASELSFALGKSYFFEAPVDEVWQQTMVKLKR